MSIIEGARYSDCWKDTTLFSTLPLKRESKRLPEELDLTCPFSINQSKSLYELLYILIFYLNVQYLSLRQLTYHK